MDKYIDELPKDNAWVQSRSSQLSSILEEVVEEHTADLDDYMAYVVPILDKYDEATPSDIEQITIKLPAMMYYVVGRLEFVGMQLDLAEQRYQAHFDSAYIESSGSGNAEHRKAIASTDAISKSVIKLIYRRAYRIIDRKLDVCEQLCSAARSVLSKKKLDMEINNSIPDYDYPDAPAEYTSASSRRRRRRVEFDE